MIKDGLGYITATYDRNNSQSGRVMRKVGMKYQCTLVTFRMYQFNLDENIEGIYKKYWDTSAVHFVETEL